MGRVPQGIRHGQMSLQPSLMRVSRQPVWWCWLVLVDHNGNEGVQSSCRDLGGEGERVIQEEQPSALLQPPPSVGAGLRSEGGFEEQSMARAEVHGQEGAWCTGSSLETQKHLRSSLARSDSWLSRITSMQGMERFAQRRGGGAGEREEKGSSPTS